jgi:transmembrane sensor
MTTVDDPTDEREPLRREAWKWVLHMTSGEATKADIAALERWCARSPLHAEAFARASGRWRAFGAAIGGRAHQQGVIDIQGSGTGRALGRRALLGGMLAASTAGAAVVISRPPFGLWPSLSEIAADYRTGTGERHRIALADSVSVEMNTRTSLNIRKAASDGADRVELIAGEAAVATGAHPIEVIAAKGRVWADTAQFNVRYNGTAVCVTCLGGMVHVEQQGRSVSMLQKQQVSYNERSLGFTTAVDPVVVTGWREGDLFFRDEPLANVIEEVNRYRPGRIVLMNEDLGRRRVTARFKLDRLEVVIIQLRETFGARVTALAGGIVLVS